MAGRDAGANTACRTRRPVNVRANRRHEGVKSERRARVQSRSQGDFFRLFLAAVDAGLLKPTAPKSLKLDSLITIIGARDPDVFDGETWPMFSAAWPEWDYAWSRAKEAEQRQRARD
jgi:hypothetical protein